MSGQNKIFIAIFGCMKERSEDATSSVNTTHIGLQTKRKIDHLKRPTFAAEGSKLLVSGHFFVAGIGYFQKISQMVKFLALKRASFLNHTVKKTQKQLE